MAIRSAPPLQIGLAVALAFLAGTVDAVGFAMLGGLFVSFMSGNSTRLGVSLATGDLAKTGQIATLIASFVVGAGCGSALAQRSGPRRAAAILVLEAALLAIAAGTSGFGPSGLATALMAAAMGLENATFVDARGETKINLTFMTGALVRLGEGLARALAGGPRLDWWPYLLLWCGLTGGVVAGTLGYGILGVPTLYVVSVALLAIAAVVFRDAGVGRARDSGAAAPDCR